MTQVINNMQRLTKSLDYILNKSENATPELFAIYNKMMHASKATHESHLNVTGVQFFSLQI